jgi:PAS domain S-box-containing protein
MTRHNGSIRRSSLDHRSAEVKEPERLSAVILDGMYQFVALLNPKGDILEVNRAALEGAGHKIEEIRGKPFWTARWWQVSEQIKQDLQAAILRAATGEFVRYEVDIFGDQSGRLPITIDFSLQPIRGESGEVEYLLPEGRNITEHKRAEEEIARQAQELRVLNERLKELDRLKMLLDITERKEAEKAMTRLAAIVESSDAEEVLGRGWHPLLHSDDGPDYIASVAEAQRQHRRLCHRVRIKNKDGECRWGESHAMPLFGAAGDYLDHVGMSIDITEEVKAEAALRESEAYFREMTQNLPLGVWTYLPDGNVDFVNDRWLQMAGQTLDYVRTRPEAWMIALHSDDRERAGKIYRESTRSGEGFTMEARFLNVATGEYRWHLIRSVPLRDAAGNLVKFISTCTDIHEQLQLREAAEQATRAKDEFLVLVSHELRSPLAAILGYTQLLRGHRQQDPEIREISDVIERNGKAQIQLIDDLLDSARIVSGKLKLEVGPVELTEVVAGALETVRSAAESRNITLDVALDATRDHQIMGDFDRLKQVVWNLLSNAVKFTPNGGRVGIRLSRRDSSVQLVVRDNGKGISPDLLPYVFDRFKQGDVSASRRFGGLGLGLALVKRLTELHGGEVKVESAGEGQGATFTVTLPPAGAGY